MTRRQGYKREAQWVSRRKNLAKWLARGDSELECQILKKLFSVGIVIGRWSEFWGQHWGLMFLIGAVFWNRKYRQASNTNKINFNQFTGLSFHFGCPLDDPKKEVSGWKYNFTLGWYSSIGERWYQ